ncbi:MAG: hypothetical protein ABF567_02825 [Acetobacter okinawensis]
MTTPTNWPNPERPGVPMFPERDGWHSLHTYSRGLFFWDSANKYWWDSQKRFYRTIPEILKDTVGTKYIGPSLTPTQIAELLAGERERCAKECDEKVAFANHELRASGSHEETRYWTGEHCAATFCADAIRGLGDKA